MAEPLLDFAVVRVCNLGQLDLSSLLQLPSVPPPPPPSGSVPAFAAASDTGSAPEPRLVAHLGTLLASVDVSYLCVPLPRLPSRVSSGRTTCPRGIGALFGANPTNMPVPALPLQPPKRGWPHARAHRGARGWQRAAARGVFALPGGLCCARCACLRLPAKQTSLTLCARSERPAPGGAGARATAAAAAGGCG